jgi:predicted nuclease with TOPRIM domain
MLIKMDNSNENKNEEQPKWFKIWSEEDFHPRMDKIEEKLSKIEEKLSNIDERWSEKGKSVNMSERYEIILFLKENGGKANFSVLREKLGENVIKNEWGKVISQRMISFEKSNGMVRLLCPKIRDYNP